MSCEDRRVAISEFMYLLVCACVGGVCVGVGGYVRSEACAGVGVLGSLDLVHLGSDRLHQVAVVYIHLPLTDPPSNIRVSERRHF